MDLGIVFIDGHRRCNVKATGAPNAGREQGAVLRQVPRRWFFPTRYLLVAAMLALGGSATAAAQTFSEFALPTSGNSAYGITVGSDGALWFTEYAVRLSSGAPNSASKIGRINIAGAISEFALPDPASTPVGIAAGPDGNLWFAEQEGNRIGRITTSGTITEFSIPTSNSQPLGIVAGPDGNIWFTEQAGKKIGQITTGGTISEFALPTANIAPSGITAGPDGNLWFTNQDSQGSDIGRISPTGVITEFAIPFDGTVQTSNSIVAGPDGALWFVTCSPNTIGRITTNGTITLNPSFSVGCGFMASESPQSIAVGPDGLLWTTIYDAFGGGSTISGFTTAGASNGIHFPGSKNFANVITNAPDGGLWFAESGQVQSVNGIATDGTGAIGRFGPLSTTASLVSAILPLSRSVQVGNPATAFATIINASASTAIGCSVLPGTSVPASFFFQTTAASTNAVIGSPGAPVSIPAGGSQSFVFGFTPTAAFSPENLSLSFNCQGTGSAAFVTGVNTLLLSASTTPVPDIIVESATASGDGILDVTGASGSAAFALATVNVGANGSITATADTGSAALPLALTICQSNPSGGQCMATPATSVAVTINTNAAPTFSVFATASGAIPFAPATNRIFVRFTDSGGAVRGATSVAVRTQ